MEKYNTREFDLIEHISPSSDILKTKIWNILKNSSDWNANIASIDRKNGSYQIILRGTLKQENYAN